MRRGSALQDVSLHRVSKTMTNTTMYSLTCNVHPGGDRHQAAPTALADWQSSILLCGGVTETVPHSFPCGEEEGHWQSSSSTVQCLMCNIQLPALHQAQHLAEGRHPRQGTTMTALSPLSCSSLYWTRPPLVSTLTTRAATSRPDDDWHTRSARTTSAMTKQQQR